MFKTITKDFPAGRVDRNPPANAGDTVKINIPVLLRFHVPGATKALVSQLLKSVHSCPGSHNYWAYVLQLLKLSCLESGLHNKRGRNKKSVYWNQEEPPVITSRESPCAAMKIKCNQK